MSVKFNVGDTVKVVDPFATAKMGHVGVVEYISGDYLTVSGLGTSFAYRFEKVEEKVDIVGKRVKLTLGESVVYGTVQRKDDHDIAYVSIEGSTTHNRFALGEGYWKLEVLPDPLPAGIGAVVRFRDEKAVWTRTGPDSWISSATNITTNDKDIQRFSKSHAPMTVLSEGVTL